LVSPVISKISASDLTVGTKVLDNGDLADETRRVPSDSKIIYARFFLDIPEESKIDLEFRWFYENNLLTSFHGRHSRGYAIATLERDPKIFPAFQPGNYRIEIWFLNTMLIDSPFLVY